MFTNAYKIDACRSVNDPSRLVTSLREHEASVIAVAWQPAGNSLTTCDKNKRVIVWADI